LGKILILGYFYIFYLFVHKPQSLISLDFIKDTEQVKNKTPVVFVEFD